jgi:serine/threonine-protein kinase
MRFIGGESLLQAIRRFHEADQSPDRDNTERELELRELLSRFLVVCDTLGYAHSRGVVHRDIKPANIMLGEFGETLVVDWGLAKVLGSAPVSEDDSTPPPPVMESGAATQTVAGAAVGTPAYMSPEQALAAHERVGPVSDIYSLGVVLYELLTGKRAIAPNVVDAVLQAVIAGDIRPPRSVNPRVSPALEAICLKAAARRQEDRYQTTAALARDIKAWLADERVTAWPEPWSVRCGRWMRRHQKLVTGISAAAFVTMVSLTLGIMAQAAANRQITAARNRAERAFTGLRRASDNFMDVVEQHLIRQAGNSPEQQRLLETGLAMYEQFLAEEPSDARVREQLAATELRVARIRFRLGQYEAAGRHAAAAVAGYSGLAREGPESAANLRGWAEGEMWRGEALRPHDPPAAEAAYREAQSVGERLRREFGDEPGDRALVARAHYNLGLMQHDLNRIAESEQSYRAAINLMTPLRDVSADAGQMDYRQDLARAYVDLGVLLREQGQPVAAAENYQLAIALYSEIAERPDVEPEVHYERATARMNLGNLYFVNRRAPEMGPEPLQRAETAYRESIFDLQQLARRYPGVPTYRKELANCHNGLGSALQQASRLDDANEAWSTARDLFEELTAESPEVAEFHNLLGLTEGNLALLARGSAPREAIYLWSSAVDHGREALRINPQHPAYRRFLTGHYRNLIPLLLDAGEVATAADRIDEMANEPSTDAASLALAAQFSARCAAASETDAQRDQFQRQSLLLLNQAIAAGYSDRANLETHADFTALRPAAEFKSLLERLPPAAAPPPMR